MSQLFKLDRISIKNRGLPLMLSAFLFTASPQPASALIIDATYSGNFSVAGAAQDAAKAAVSFWQNITAPWEKVTAWHVPITFSSLNIDYLDAASTLISPYALTYGNSQTATPYAPTGTYLWTGATVGFNTNQWNSFWWDPTPTTNTEFNMNQYGGIFGTATDASAVGMEDGFSVLLHELGHALGFMGASGSLTTTGNQLLSWSAYTSFADNLPFFTYDYITPLKGQTVTMNDAFHVSGTTYPYDSMNASGGGSGPQVGQRILISALDLNMIADAFHVVPTPTPLSLLALGLCLIFLVSSHPET